MSDHSETRLGLRRRERPLVRAAVVLGIGLGGFFDGIVIHQILQWHHMLSSHPNPAVAADLRLNVMADGFFHAVTYAFTVAGVALLWSAWRDPAVPRSGRTLFGGAVLGWGLFNVVEGMINHQILGVHHVWPAGPGSVALWDAAFLVWGLLFIAGGYALVRGSDAGSTADTGSAADGAETSNADSLRDTEKTERSE